MKVIILNAAPGVGKSTLLKLMEKALPNGCAIVDGDDVGRIIPLQVSIEWLNLIQDNMVSCAKNYRDFGIKYLIISFVFPSQERIDRLLNLLRNNNIQLLYTYSLICDDAEIRKRIFIRNTTRVMNCERAIECNAKIKLIKSDFLVDTTHKEASEVLEEFIKTFSQIVKQDNKGAI